MCITPAKANTSADMVESKPYTWTSCEEMEKNVGWEGVPLARVNGVIILGMSGICTWYGHLALA